MSDVEDYPDYVIENSNNLYNFQKEMTNEVQVNIAGKEIVKASTSIDVELPIIFTQKKVKDKIMIMLLR
ncbi:hypothetical protein OKW22_001358 [Bacilli bacterium PM5-3]|nr:hypothetical protein [Bacilli bacterium PM5-3]